MTRHLNSATPFASWPCEDQQAWTACFAGADLFDDGPGSNLSSSTIYARKQAYGMWLRFLDTVHPDALFLAPEERVGREQVEDFVTFLRENCRDTTVFHVVARLFYVARAMFPHREWDWLYRLSRRIAAQAIPIEYRPVFSDDLYRLGRRLMARAMAVAERSSRITKGAAFMYRDGLLIAVLAVAPMRRRPFSRLRISEHLVKVGGRWVIMVPAELTKTKVAQEYELSERLSAAMDRYLQRFRLAFPGAEDHDWLWVYEGRPMTDKMIRRRTIAWTRGALGFEVSPHRFRTAAANFISVADPENIRTAKDLLGHKSFAMTEKHYIDAAQSRLAGRELSRLLSGVGTLH